MMSQKKLLGLLVASLMIISLHAQGGNVSTQPDLTTPELMQTSEPPGEGLNRTKVAETVAYHRTIDDGYTTELATPRGSLDLYQYFDAIGSLYTEDVNRFSQYVNERYDPDNGFSYVPRSYSSSSLQTDYHQSRLAIAIIYLELGNTLSTQVQDNLETEAQSYLTNNDVDIQLKADAAKFLNLTNSISAITKVDVENSLYNYQNNNTASEFYGAIAQQPGETDDFYHHLAYAVDALQIVNDLNLDLTQSMNTTSLRDYIDRLQYTFSASEHDKYDGVDGRGLNYNLTFKDSPSGGDNLYDLIHWRIEDWSNTFSAYTVLKMLQNHGLPISFDFTGAEDILLYRTYDRFWIDENGDTNIDREPYLRYMGSKYLGSHQVDAFAGAIDKLGIGPLIDMDTARNELSRYILEKGGATVNFGGSSIQSTAKSLLTLYYLDRDSRSYINDIDYQSSLDYMLNHNVTVEKTYTAANGSTLTRNITTFAQNTGEYYESLYEKTLNNDIFVGDESKIEATRWLFEILDALNESNHLNPIEHTLQEYYVYLVETNNYNFRTPTSALPLVKGASLLGMDHTQLNYTRVIHRISNQQTISGGFADSAWWDQSLEYATDLLDFTGLIFNTSDYTSTILSDVSTESYGQGISYFRGEGSPDLEPTQKMVSFLNQSGDLSTLISGGTLNKTKLRQIAEFRVENTTQYTNIPYDVKRFHEQVGIYRDLGYSQSDLFTNTDLNRSETIRWLQDLQYDSANAPSSEYIGLFGEDITDTGDIEDPYSTVRASYYAISSLQFMGELSQIDTNAAKTAIKDLQNTDSSDTHNYGLFAQNPQESWWGVQSSVYAFQSLDLLSGSPSVTDITSTLDNRFSGENFYVRDYQHAFGLVGYGGVTASTFNTTLVNKVLEDTITKDGFLSDEVADAHSTYSGFYTLNLLNDTSLINSQETLKFSASLQETDETDYQYGGFTQNRFTGYTDLENTYFALYTLFLEDSLTMVNTTSASLYIMDQFESFDQSAKIYTHSMRFVIFPAIRALSTLTDVLYPVVVAPVEVVQGLEPLNMTIEVYDMFFERVANSSVKVYFDGSLLSGSISETSTGLFEFSYSNTSSFDIGTHTVNVTVDHPDFQSHTLSFTIEVVKDSLQWIQNTVDTKVPENETWDLTGDLYDALANPVTGAAFNYTLSGPSTSGFSLTTTDNGDGSYVLSLSHTSNNMTQGTYNITITASTSDRKPVTFSYVFDVVDAGQEGSQDTNTDTEPTANTEEQTQSPEIALPGYGLYVSFVGLVGLMVFRRKAKKSIRH